MTNEVRGRASSRLPGVRAQGRGMVRGYPEYYEELYREYGNPLWAWKALLAVRKAELPVPDWVMQYLARSGESLVNAGSQSEVARALGFSRRRLDYKSRDTQDNRLYARQIFEMLGRMYPTWSEYRKHKTIAGDLDGSWTIERVKSLLSRD